MIITDEMFNDLEKASKKIGKNDISKTKCRKLYYRYIKDNTKDIYRSCIGYNANVVKNYKLKTIKFNIIKEDWDKNPKKNTPNRAENNLFNLISDMNNIQRKFICYSSMMLIDGLFNKNAQSNGKILTMVENMKNNSEKLINLYQSQISFYQSKI